MPCDRGVRCRHSGGVEPSRVTFLCAYCIDPNPPVSIRGSTFAEVHDLLIALTINFGLCIDERRRQNPLSIFLAKEQELHFLERDLSLAPAVGKDSIPRYTFVEEILESMLGGMKKSHDSSGTICQKTREVVEWKNSDALIRLAAAVEMSQSRTCQGIARGTSYR